MSNGHGAARNGAARPRDVAQLVQTVSHCGRHLRRALTEHVSRFDLSDTEFLLLWSCGQTVNHGIAQNELAQIVGVSPAQLSGLIDRLSARQLVAAKRCREDRRRQLVKLTPAGRETLNQALAGLDTLASRLGPEMPTPQHHSVIELLNRIVGALQEVPELRVFGGRESATQSQEKRA